MQKGVVFLILLLFIPLAYSLSVKDLISRYSFSKISNEINIVSYSDFMVDKNNNGINDTLVFELETDNQAGYYIFVLNLNDKNGILTNVTEANLSAGINRMNLTFNSFLLSKNQFNYSIKAYNTSLSQKLRIDNLITQYYQNYEEGIRILSVKDHSEDNLIKINITVNSSIIGTFETLLFTNYNNSIIQIKSNHTINNSIRDLQFEIDDETIKRTHFSGTLNITSIRIGKKMIKMGYLTDFYDFRDFASSSHIDGFADSLYDSDSDGIYDSLKIDAFLNIKNGDEYWIVLGIYDLSDNLIEIKNVSGFLNYGIQKVTVEINGSKIFSKKLDGPYIVKHATLFEDGAFIDRLNDAYITNYYAFNNFSNSRLPDLLVEIKASGEHNYGVNNATVNVTVKNIGNKNAFNVFADIFDNKSIDIFNITGLISPNSMKLYQFNFTNFSDFEITAIADFDNFVEELNESNNAERISVKLNHRPVIDRIQNMKANATNNIIINISAFDFDGDDLHYSINNSKFSKDYNIFEWNTSISDSGEYTMEASVSDGYLKDSVFFNIIILNISGNETMNDFNDLDNDGINDTIDRLIANQNSINTSTLNIIILINKSTNLSRLFNKNLPVKIMDGKNPVLEFSFNFAKFRLNLTNVAIDKQSNNSIGSVYIDNLALPKGVKKTAYIDRINMSMNGVCIKDTNVSSIQDISQNCNSVNEVKINCNGLISFKPYKCTYNSKTKRYKITGLSHSGIRQIKI